MKQYTYYEYLEKHPELKTDCTECGGTGILSKCEYFKAAEPKQYWSKIACQYRGTIKCPYIQTDKCCNEYYNGVVLCDGCDYWDVDHNCSDAFIDYMALRVQEKKQYAEVCAG